MKIEKKLQDLENKIIYGLEEAYRKMVIVKKQNNSPLIVSRDGKVVAIPPDEIPPTVKYK
ncbi:MAG: hypothetical protein ISR82_06050 [Candidatus Marinimicrobia bacterium]|nr:hypothetical protein [Candidatus Neomarinimicrobiota bacterium]MBL7010766.1 hypothetical protein [Candidatus Neomarinimicrobiota bacterium]MBL7031171.1 hypothetical protein [Candidatus Neomarinimicrobiota bacterium]